MRETKGLSMGWIRLIGAAGLALGLAACASAPPPPPAPPPFPMVRSAGAWAFDYDATTRTATATLRSPQGALLVEISCEAPRGPIEVRDWTFALPPGPAPLRMTLGAAIVSAAGDSPASSAASTGVRFAVSPLDMAVLDLYEGQTVAVLGPANGHDWGADAAGQVISVANACATRGS
jgi:hypothetical protein